MKISPHVQIYKFPITAISSITNRLTGLSMSGFFILGGLSCLAEKNNLILRNYRELNDFNKKIVNYSIAYPFTYHTLGGIRHFIWDKYPSLLKNKSVSKSSIILIGISFPLTYLTEYLIML